MLTQEFIAGFVSANGSFLEFRKNFNISFAFQIKTTLSNASLLNQIAATLELDNRVYLYDYQKQAYALLVVRDRESLLAKIIPFFDNHLVGQKEQIFNEWRSKIVAYSSTWNYRNIKSTINPQSYQVVDKKPNTEAIK